MLVLALVEDRIVSSVNARIDSYVLSDSPRELVAGILSVFASVLTWLGGSPLGIVGLAAIVVLLFLVVHAYFDTRQDRMQEAEAKPATEPPRSKPDSQKLDGGKTRTQSQPAKSKLISLKFGGGVAAEWGRHKQGSTLSVRLLNSTNDPIVEVATTVVDLARWSGRDFQRDDGPKEVYVTGNVTVNPEPFLSSTSDAVDYPLVINRGSEFEIKSNRTPCTRVARSVAGLWMLVVTVKAKSSPFLSHTNLFVSWESDRSPPLQIEGDPRQP